MSVIIITRNEEANLSDCLATLPAGVEIVVVDSESTDKTVAMAEAFGCRVFQRPFADFASQKNYAIAQATGDWVLSIDADERIDAHLCAEIVRASCPTPAGGSGSGSDAARQPVGYRVTRRLVFLGKMLRFGRSVDTPIRLFRRGAGEFRGAVHESLYLSGPVSTLALGVMAHHSYRNLNDYFVRFNDYTTRIALQKLGAGYSLRAHVFVVRPFFEFVVRYFFRLGFLDGYPGFVYAMLGSFYAFVKYAKLHEQRALIAAVRAKP